MNTREFQMNILKGYRVKIKNHPNWYKVARVGFIDSKQYITLFGFDGVVWTDDIEDIRL